MTPTTDGDDPDSDDDDDRPADSPDSPIQAVIIQAVIGPSVFPGKVFARSPRERHEYHLQQLGLRCHVLTDTRPSHLAPELLWIDGDTVVDPRLYRAAWEHPGPVVVSDGAPIGIAKITADDARGAIAAGRFAPPPSLPRLEVDAIPAYLPQLRRRLRPYWCRLAQPGDQARAEAAVLDAAQKGVLDFPARYLHPPPENALARALSRTRVTPNQVTVVSALVAFTATYLFAIGQTGLALALALLANVLDGVDGKLARITLRTSKGGDRLDHSLDVTFEFTWYLAIGYALTHSGALAGGLQTAVAIIATMIGCRAVSGTYRLLAGASIHDHTAFDRGFRLVAGRRNIYVLMLLVGHLTGTYAASFRAVLYWALATAGVYVCRNLIAAARRIAGR